MATGLKQFVMRWKHTSLLHRRSFHHFFTSTTRYPPSGFLFVFVGPERKRFVIPVRYLNLHIFQCLLGEAEDEFGLVGYGCLVMPCEIALFKEIIKHLKKDERKYGKFSLEEFANVVVNFNSYEENIVPFTTLLHKATTWELWSCFRRGEIQVYINL